MRAVELIACEITPVTLVRHKSQCAHLQRVLVVFGVENGRHGGDRDTRLHLRGHQRVGQLHA